MFRVTSFWEELSAQAVTTNIPETGGLKLERLIPRGSGGWFKIKVPECPLLLRALPSLQVAVSVCILTWQRTEREREDASSLLVVLLIKGANPH